MALLPKNLRFWLFDRLSLKTMRYVHALPYHRTDGVVRQTYDMIREDFFINGSLTSRSRVPALLAAVWTLGRESILVDDQLDRTTKEAMTAVLSGVNECPYCGDMLISLVHSGGRHADAVQILAESEHNIEDPVLRAQLTWVRAVATPGTVELPPMPFTAEQLPEAIASLAAMSDINRFSHIVMDGSPVTAPLGMQHVKAAALWMFGGELRPTHRHPLEPGRALQLLPAADLPADMRWAKSNHRIADSLARWSAAVEREGQKVIPPRVHECVNRSLRGWQGELMPISRSWVDDEVGDLAGEQRAIAKLALVLAKAPYQADETLTEAVLGYDRNNEERFIRILAWSTFTAARYFANRIANLAQRSLDETRQAA